MLSRALSLATVMLLIGFATVPVQAQNLEAGKTPSQIFSGSCAVCHKSPRGLLKTVAPGALPGFLRQHYTTSSDMAGALSAYLISNGASDTRYGGGGLTKQGAESRSEPKPGAEPAEPARGRRRVGEQEAVRPDSTRPDADGLEPQERRPGRHGKRLARPTSETPDAGGKPVEREQPASASEAPRGKQKLGKKGRRDREETVNPDSAKAEPKGEPSKSEPAKGEAIKVETPKTETPKAETPKTETPKSEPAKSEPAKEETGKPAEEAKQPEPAKSEPPVLRADPVPAVTPAPKASDTESKSAPAETPAPAAAEPAPPAAPKP